MAVRSRWEATEFRFPMPSFRNPPERRRGSEAAKRSPVDETDVRAVPDHRLEARSRARVEPNHHVVAVDLAPELVEEHAAAVADDCTGALAACAG